MRRAIRAVCAVLGLMLMGLPARAETVEGTHEGADFMISVPANWRQMTIKQVRDSIPIVLEHLARALASAEPQATFALLEATKLHGSDRFHQSYNVAELITEYRLLRQVLIDEVKSELGPKLVLPYVVAVFANFAGGAASDALVRRLGAKRGRRQIGATALAAAAAFTVAAMLTHRPVLTVVFLALTYGAITFQQSGVFGVCLDIGGPHAGATVGLMNMIAQVGGLTGSVLYGYIVDRSGSYDAPFVPMAVLLFVGTLLWFRIDASKTLSAETASG